MNTFLNILEVLVIIIPLIIAYFKTKQVNEVKEELEELKVEFGKEKSALKSSNTAKEESNARLRRKLELTEKENSNFKNEIASLQLASAKNKSAENTEEVVVKAEEKPKTKRKYTRKKRKSDI